MVNVSDDYVQIYEINVLSIHLLRQFGFRYDIRTVRDGGVWILIANESYVPFR